MNMDCITNGVSSASWQATRTARQPEQAGKTGPTEVAQQLFDQLDTAHHGYLTKADLQTAMDTVTLSPQAVAASNAAQSGANGTLDALMTKLDGNGDGQVTQMEFGYALGRAAGRHGHHRPLDGDDDGRARHSAAGTAPQTADNTTATAASGGTTSATAASVTTSASASTTAGTTASTSSTSSTAGSTTTTQATASGAPASATPTTTASLTETVSATHVPKGLDALFAKLDANGDGKVTMQEFTDALGSAFRGFGVHRGGHHHHARHAHRGHHGHNEAGSETQGGSAASAAPSNGSSTAPTTTSANTTAASTTTTSSASGAALLRVMRMLHVYAGNGGATTQSAAAPPAQAISATA